MSARHALLGLLLNRSAYPYELADRLERSLGPAWAVNSGQLYQTIGRLERDGLIECVDPSARGREDRHVFTITRAGVEEFERWFAEVSGKVRLSRRPVLAKITLAGPRRLEGALRELEAYEQDCAASLRDLTSRREMVALDSKRLRADHVLLRLNLSADIYQLEGELRWTTQARETVCWLVEQDAIWPRERDHGAAWQEEDVERQTRTRLFHRGVATRLRSVPDGEGDGC